MTMTPRTGGLVPGTFSRLTDNVDRALQGKRDVVSLVLASMLAEGHVLLEDAPGTGKTSLAKLSPRPCRAPARASSSRPTSSRRT